MAFCATSILLTKTFSVTFFSRLGNNIIGGVRKELYESVLRKEIGWHDNRDNSSGVVTSTLASDV